MTLQSWTKPVNKIKRYVQFWFYIGMNSCVLFTVTPVPPEQCWV